MATLEDFFLADYERLRSQVKELEQRIEQMKPRKYGIVDLGRNQELVKVVYVDHYYLKDAVKTSADANAVLAKTGDELLKWARSTSCGYHDSVIAIRRMTYPFTVQVENLTSVSTYATDGCKEYVPIDRETMEEHMGDNLERWCLPEYEDELVKAALSELREDLCKLVEKYEREEQEADNG